MLGSKKAHLPHKTVGFFVGAEHLYSSSSGISSKSSGDKSASCRLGGTGDLPAMMALL
jgi:hypothetical protein